MWDLSGMLSIKKLMCPKAPSFLTKLLAGGIHCDSTEEWMGHQIRKIQSFFLISVTNKPHHVLREIGRGDLGRGIA